MRIYFLNYRKLFFSFFTVIFLLWTAQLFGLNFGIDASVLNSFFWFLFFLLVISEIKSRWRLIHLALGRVLFGIKNNFLERRENLLRKMVDRDPERLTSKTGPVIMTFATILAIFGGLWQTLKSFILSKYNILAAVSLGIVLDILAFTFTSDWLILFLVCLWLLSIKRFKFTGIISVAGGLFFLFFCPFLLILKKESFAEKTAIWAYIFLAIGVAQMFVEYLKDENKK
ncbi:MAG TPA: hypothetical protein VMW41_05155 [Candidatus Bathyarchaeia archaeon]|nr:hypothetical protein [Candidatus Bathyarchaeia archaeon]